MRGGGSDKGLCIKCIILVLKLYKGDIKWNGVYRIRSYASY